MSEEVPVKYLSREDVRRKGAIHDEDFYVSALDGHVKVRGLTLGQRREMRKRGMTPRENPDGTQGWEIDLETMEVEAILLGARDPEDPARPLFARGDAEWLQHEIAGGGASQLANKILELSGMGGNAAKKPSGSSGATPSS